jgi:hypothetical protein
MLVANDISEFIFTHLELLRIFSNYMNQTHLQFLK